MQSCRRAMEILGTYKNTTVYYCTTCDKVDGNQPIREFYRKDGLLYERVYTLAYSYKEREGGSLKDSDFGWQRTKHILLEREAKAFPSVGQSAPTN